MSTIVWGSLFLVIAIWYAINVIIYKGYYDDESAEMLYAEYEKLNPGDYKKQNEKDEEEESLLDNQEDGKDEKPKSDKGDEKPKSEGKGEDELNEGGSKRQSMVQGSGSEGGHEDQTGRTETHKEGGDEQSVMDKQERAPIVDPVEQQPKDQVGDVPAPPHPTPEKPEGLQDPTKPQSEFPEEKK